MKFSLIACGPKANDLAVQIFDSLEACLAEARNCLALAASGLEGVGSSIRLSITTVEGE